MDTEERALSSSSSVAIRGIDRCLRMDSGWKTRILNSKFNVAAAFRCA